MDRGRKRSAHVQCSTAVSALLGTKCEAIKRTTPSKSNMEAQNDGLEDDVPFQRGHFQVPC